MTKHYTANLVTVSRILLALLLPIFSISSPWFLVLYLLCGLSDMIDGVIARATNSASTFGARLDTVADFIFLLMASLKILPAMEIPAWLWFWIGSIAAIKLGNITVAFLKGKKIVVPHTVMNKITGLLLFLFPLTLSYVDLQYSGVVICSFATAAAVQEGYYIRTGRKNMFSF